MKIDEMKRALNKDLDKNELNIIENRNSGDLIAGSEGRPSCSTQKARIKIF